MTGERVLQGSRPNPGAGGDVGHGDRLAGMGHLKPGPVGVETAIARPETLHLPADADRDAPAGHVRRCQMPQRLDRGTGRVEYLATATGQVLLLVGCTRPPHKVGVSGRSTGRSRAPGRPGTAADDSPDGPRNEGPPPGRCSIRLHAAGSGSVVTQLVTQTQVPVADPGGRWRPLRPEATEPDVRPGQEIGKHRVGGPRTSADGAAIRDRCQASRRQHVAVTTA
jgi:hypothetical protein